MTTYVYRNGKLVDKATAPPKDVKHGTAANVISDCMPETKHMADGAVYTSKSAFRRATRAAGCIEVGTETAALTKPREQMKLDTGSRRDAIRQSIYNLRNR